MSRKRARLVAPKTQPETVYLAFDDDHVVTIQTVKGSVALTAIDGDSLAVLRSYCQKRANSMKKSIHIVGFTVSSVYETFAPSTTGGTK